LFEGHIAVYEGMSGHDAIAMLLNFSANRPCRGAGWRASATSPCKS
jgi:hypothetical protein